MNYAFPVVLSLLALPAFAEGSRDLDAHEHGVGALNIAIDGAQVAIEFHAPGADIVGFEYAAESAEDRAAIDAAVATLARPLDLFVVPAAAECSVTQASAGLESEEEAHDDHGHDDHAAEETSHTEFHAEYLLTCADTDALSGLTFAYFDVFENARALDVQIVSADGAKAFEVERDAPTLDLKGMF